MHYASYVGKRTIVNWALSKGANIERKTEKGETALMLSGYLCQGNVFQLLIDNGANINAQKKDGTCVLSQLLTDNYYGQYELAHQLLNNPSLNLNVRDEKGRTPLLVYLKNKEKHENNQGSRLLPHLIHRRNHRLFEREQNHFLNKDQKGNTFLHSYYLHVKKPFRNSTLIGDIQIEDVINVQNNEGKTPLMLAVENIDSKKLDREIKFLIEHGDNVNMQDNNGNTVLHYPGLYNPKENIHVNNFHYRAVLSSNRRNENCIEPNILIRNNKGETCYDVVINTYGMAAFRSIEYMGL